MKDDLVESSSAMVESRGLSKFYGEFAAVQNISFSVPAGQVCAFLGPNGAGKSTTMKMLPGFLAPSSGVARLGSTSSSRSNSADSATDWRSEWNTLPSIAT